MHKRKRLLSLLLAFVTASLLCATALASSGATGNVAAVLESTWIAAAGQVKTVVDRVVFPALDLILTVAFFVKICMAYFDYRKHGQFEWAGPVILFACLVLALTAPLYIWTIVGL